MVYGIFTAGQRTWGGPRADAGKADEKTTPEQAIEKAAARGDELNVIPETFKPALEVLRHRRPHHPPLLPSEHLEGRFTSAEPLAGGWFRQVNDSGALHSDMTPRHAEEGLMYSQWKSRGSLESWHSASSASTSIYTPRRVESVVDLEDALTYHDRQARQRPAGGAYLENTNAERTAPAFSNGPVPTHNRYAESVQSFESDSSVSLHFDVPARRPTMDFSGPGATSAPPPVRQSSRHIQQDHPHPAPLESNPAMPTMPRRAYHPPNRYTSRPESSSSATGKSPLARKSFTRLASDYAASTGGDTAETGMSRRHSVAGDGRRGRRSVSIDSRGRRRLSKQRPGQRSASQQ